MIGIITIQDFRKYEIIVKDHAVNQWRVRVKPDSVLSDEEIKASLIQQLKNSYIHFLLQNYYELDYDIIFVALLKKEKIIIPTIYGSKNNNCALYNFKTYLKNRQKYGRIHL